MSETIGQYAARRGDEDFAAYTQRQTGEALLAALNVRALTPDALRELAAHRNPIVAAEATAEIDRRALRREADGGDDELAAVLRLAAERVL